MGGQFILSCDSTEPTDDQKPGRRDYTWNIDTLIIPFNILRKTWGSSPTDVWAIGPGGPLNKTIYHYDGSSWSTDGLFRNLSPTSIYGCSANNIWIGGMDGKIWHFNGIQFSQILEDSIIGFEKPIFTAIYVDSPQNIYATGFAQKAWNDYYRIGVILYYDGNSWQHLQLPEIKVDFYRIEKGANGNFYLEALRNEPMFGDTTKIFKYDGKELRQIHSAPDNIDQKCMLVRIGNEIYFEFKGKINSYDGVSFIEQLNLNMNSNYVYTMFGRNLNDIFIYMEDGVAHYNGTDIAYVLKFQGPSIPIVSSLYFEKDVFFLGYDFSVNQQIIIHGKLN